MIKIRKKWSRSCITKVKKSKKIYNRKKIKQQPINYEI